MPTDKQVPEAKLQPGWLARDVERASKRADEWRQEAMPTDKQDMTAVSELLLEGCVRHITGECRTRRCFIENGWDGKTLPIPIKAKCAELQAVETIASLTQRVENAEYELKRFYEARAQNPDWEKLWEEQANAREATEAKLAAAEAKVGALAKALGLIEHQAQGSQLDASTFAACQVIAEIASRALSEVK